MSLQSREVDHLFENKNHQNGIHTSLKSAALGKVGVRLERVDQIGRQGLILYSQRLNIIARRSFEVNSDGLFTEFPISYITWKPPELPYKQHKTLWSHQIVTN